jgi:pyrroloquinoline-quinone synthase
MSDKLLSPEEFEAKLRAIGTERYHDLHPFHKLLHGGKLNKGQVQAWALNRYYYQACIPQKDAALMARLEDRELRREWRHRLEDHDGWAEGPEFGGIERWLKLTDALGLDRDYVISTQGILAGTRFAVDAYVKFVYDKPILEAIASSLTELFAPSIHRERIVGMLEHYPYINEDTVAYFRRRLDQAPRDSVFALGYVIKNATTRAEQEKVAAALTFKTQVLWAQLDALHYSYVTPGLIPPGAFVPEQ